MEQLMLGMVGTIKTPLRYPGAKSRAVRSLLQFIPSDVDEMVSPFFGGGSFELALTARGIRVHGYDLFPPLVKFWDVLLSRPQLLCDRIQEMLTEFTAEEFVEFQRGRFGELESVLDEAAMFLILCNLSWNGRAMRVGGLSRYYIDDAGIPRTDYEQGGQVLIWYDRIRDFQNSLVSVGVADFQDALNSHPELFSYLDPPYPTPYYGVYGDSAVYHEKFDHEALCALLAGRERWLLSYNDTEVVRDLYPEPQFQWDYVTWNHTSRSKGRCAGDDVVIRPKG